MTIVLPIMKIVLRMKKIARYPKSSRHFLHSSLPNNIETKVVYIGTKLDSNFQIKGKTKFDHKHNLGYCVKCPECQEDYIGEIGMILHEPTFDHSGKDRKSTC